MKANTSDLTSPALRQGWRWLSRLAATALFMGVVLFVLLAGVVARPWVLVPPVNWLLADQPVRISVDDARLEAPFGWHRPSRWRWRVEGFALVSHKPGLPTLMADEIVFRMPDPVRSWQTAGVVIPRANARGFTVFILVDEIAPPFEEVDTWPIRSLVIDQGVLRAFQLVMRDVSGTVIVLDQIDGQIVDFRHDFEHRLMYGRGACQDARVVVGPIEATGVQAIPIEFDGRTMIAHGFGTVANQHTMVVFGVDGLFRPAAAIHAVFELEGGDVRSLLQEMFGADAPDADGKLWGLATFDSKPPQTTLDMRIRLEDGEITLADDTKAILLTALRLASFVELEDHLVRLGTLSGRVSLADGVITLTDGRYEAGRSAAQVDGRMDRTSVRGRVRFSPAPGSGAMSWGLVLSGSPTHPKVQLAGQKVLEAWSLDGPEAAQDIRYDVKEARADRRAIWKEAREADPDEPEVGQDDTSPPLVGPILHLP